MLPYKAASIVTPIISRECPVDFKAIASPFGFMDQANPVKPKPCVMCAEAIHPSASKCKHCGSYQHWLERVSTWTTVLSLLVALLAITAAIAPAIKNLVTPTGPALRLSAPQFSNEAVTIRATNIGGEPAMLDHLVLTIPQKGPGQPYIFILSSKDSREVQDVEPGESAVLTFMFDRKAYDPPNVMPDDSPCELEIFNSHRRVSCDEVRYLVTVPAKNDRRGHVPEEGPMSLSPEPKWEEYPR